MSLHPELLMQPQHGTLCTSALHFCFANGNTLKLSGSRLAAKSIPLDPISKIQGIVTLPGSKSLSNRVLLLAALSQGLTCIENILVTLSCLESPLLLAAHHSALSLPERMEGDKLYNQWTGVGIRAFPIQKWRFSPECNLLSDSSH